MRTHFFTFNAIVSDFFILTLIQTGNTKAVEILLKNGANPNAVNKFDKKSPLQLAFARRMFYTVFKLYSKIYFALIKVRFDFAKLAFENIAFPTKIRYIPLQVGILT